MTRASSMPGVAFACAALGLAAAARQADAERAGIAVTSPGGHFVARIAKAAGQERVPDAIARWRVEVHAKTSSESEPAWSAAVRHDAEPRLHVLSEDGRVFASVDTLYTESRALVRIALSGGGSSEVTASALGIERHRIDRETRRWLGSDDAACRWRWFETPLGAAPFLELGLAYGERRWIDVDSGDVLVAEPGPGEVLVDPAIVPELASRLEIPYVGGRSVPERIRWGDVLELEVWGQHPTPNWRLVGFEARVEGTTLVLVPRSEPPGDRIQLQVLDSYRCRVRVHGLAPGRYSIDVRGRESEHMEPAVVEVLRAQAVVELRRRGGLLGLDERVRLFHNGIALVESNRMPGGPHAAFAPRAEVERIDHLLAVLPHEPAPPRIAGSDLIESTLAWEREGRVFNVSSNAPAPAGALGDVLEALAKLRP